MGGPGTQLRRRLLGSHVLGLQFYSQHKKNPKHNKQTTSAEQNPNPFEKGVVAQASKPSPQEVVAGGLLQVPAQPGLYSEFRANQGQEDSNNKSMGQ